MTSRRKHKKQARELGLTESELQLAEMLEEVLEAMRWMQILAYSNQYLVHRKLKLSRDEQNHILEAATRAVDKDAKMHEWRQRLQCLKDEALQIKRRVNRARRELGREKAAPKTADQEGDGGS